MFTPTKQASFGRFVALQHWRLYWGLCLAGTVYFIVHFFFSAMGWVHDPPFACSVSASKNFFAGCGTSPIHRSAVVIKEQSTGNICQCIIANRCCGPRQRIGNHQAGEREEEEVHSEAHDWLFGSISPQVDIIVTNS
jgi:hypothetical protein